jgi:hypothetical protein
MTDVQNCFWDFILSFVSAAFVFCHWHQNFKQCFLSILWTTSVPPCIYWVLLSFTFCIINQHLISAATTHFFTNKETFHVHSLQQNWIGLLQNCMSSFFWENRAICTMAVAKGKHIILHKNHIGSSIYCALAPLSQVCSPQMTRVLDSHYFTKKGTLLIHHEETTNSHSDVTRSPQQWHSTHYHTCYSLFNCTSHSLFFKYYVGMCKNSEIPGIT